MNQDPSAVGRARVAAETFAQVANSFVEEISWKTLVSIFVLQFSTPTSALSATWASIAKDGHFPV